MKRVYAVDLICVDRLEKVFTNFPILDLTLGGGGGGGGRREGGRI